MSTLWFILINNSMNRQSALKILTAKFTTEYVTLSESIYLQEFENPLKQETVQEIIRTNNQTEGLLVEPQIVISAFCNCMEDSDISVIKKTLDFFIQN